MLAVNVTVCNQLKDRPVDMPAGHFLIILIDMGMPIFIRDRIMPWIGNDVL